MGEKCNCEECQLLDGIREAHAGGDAEKLYGYCKTLWARLECAETDVVCLKERSQESLRDHFAGQALAGVRWTPKKTSKATTLKDLDVWTALIARACYLTADAMLAARKQ